MNTPNRSDPEKFEREFEDFLRDDDSRLAALYRKLPQAEPDAQLDARVRAIAQRGLLEEVPAAVSATASARRPTRWLPALSAAAVLVLAAGIAWQVGPGGWSTHDKPAVSSFDVTPTVAPEAEKSEAAAAPQDLGKDVASAANPNHPTTLSSTSPLVPMVTAPPTPAPSGDTEHSRKFQREIEPIAAPAAGSAKNTDTPLGQTLPELAKKSKTMSRPAPAQPASVSAAAKKDAAAKSEVSLEQTAEPVANDAATAPSQYAAPAPPAAPASAPPTDVAPASPAPPAVRATPMVEGEPAPAAVAAAPPSANTTASFAHEKAKPVELQERRADTAQDHWLERIRFLLQHQRRDEAIRNLQQFRKRYPEYVLPDDLRELK